MAVTYNNLYLDLRTKLRRSGIEEATQAAREMVCSASGKTKEELLRDGALYAPPETERAAYELAQRHLNPATETPEQVQQILRGKKPFV